MENSESKKRGGARPGAGAKPKPEALKRSRRVLYLTDAEWLELLAIAPAEIRARLDRHRRD